MNDYKNINSILDFKNIEDIQKQCKLQFLASPFKILSKTGYFLLKDFIQFKKQYTLKQLILTFKHQQNRQNLVSQIISFNTQFYIKQKQFLEKLDKEIPLFKPIELNTQDNIQIIDNKQNKDNTLLYNKLQQNSVLSNQKQQVVSIIRMYISDILSKTRQQFNINDFIKYITQLQTYIKNYENIKQQGLQKTLQLLEKEIGNLLLNINRKTFIRLTDLETEKLAKQLSSFLFKNK